MTRPIRILVVDDELLARKTIENLLALDPDVELCGSCADGISALAAIEAERPDLVFLDIQMPEMDGFELLDALTQRLPADQLPAFIFATAFDHYALRAFEVHAVDYLLKPFSDARFGRALDYSKKQISGTRSGELREQLQELVLGRSRPSASAAASGQLPVKEKGRVHFLKLAEITWFEAADHYVAVHTRAGVHLIRESMARLEKRLDPARFLRVHRSAIVNAECVRELRIPAGEECELLLDSGEILPVSRRRGKVLKARLGL